MKIKVRSIISFFIGTLLVFSLSIMIFISFIKFNFLKSDSYLNILKSQHGEEQVYEALQQDLNYALVVSNLPVNLSEGIISEEEVSKQYDNYLKNIINYLATGENTIEDIDTEIYLKGFDEKLNKYLLLISLQEIYIIYYGIKN